jgi:hypothetical protein
MPDEYGEPAQLQFGEKPITAAFFAAAWGCGVQAAA